MDKDGASQLYAKGEDGMTLSRGRYVFHSTGHLTAEAKVIMGEILIIVFLILVTVTVPMFAEGDTNSVRVLDKIIAERGLDGLILRESSIDAKDIPLLELFFSASTISQLRKHFPITTWQSFYDILYTYSSLKEMTIYLEPRVLVLRLLFDLDGDWPWKDELKTGYQSVETVNTSLRTADDIIAERGLDKPGLRKRSIDVEDVPLLELFFPASAISQLRESFPITTWHRLHDLKYRPCPILHDTPPVLVCSKLQATMLRFFFDIEGSWPCEASIILNDIRLVYNNTPSCNWAFFLTIDEKEIPVYRHIGPKIVYTKSFDANIDLNVTAIAVNMSASGARGSALVSFDLCCPSDEAVQTQVLEVRVYEYQGPAQEHRQNSASWQFEIEIDVT